MGVSTHAHIPVLAGPVLELLAPAAGEVYVDCTAGRGGHARAAAARLGPEGTVVLNDLDAGNLDAAAAYVRDGFAGRVEAVRGNFADLPRTLGAMGLRADVVLADLGFASNQVDDAARGFSFRADGPLDMRLDGSAPITAAELVNTLSERELAEQIGRLGEERNARRVARKIVEARGESPIETTGRLARVVRSAFPDRAGPGPRIDPATRTFQALRILTNDELGSLASLLGAVARGAESAGEGWLGRGARIGMIAFHSLEDRPVKKAFADLERRGLAEAVARGVVTAGEDEIEANRRARSAKLRVIRLTGG